MRPRNPKRQQQDRRDKPGLQRYRDEHQECALCYERCGNWYAPKLELHHLAGRNGRDFNNLSNVLMLCPACHRWAHSSKDHLGVLITAKLECDPWASLAVIFRIRGRRVVPLAIPPEFIRLREANRA